MTITMKQQAINLIKSEFGNGEEFTLNQMEALLPDAHPASLRVCIGRDLIKENFVEKFNDPNNKRKKIYRLIKEKSKPVFNYADIGKSIESLIEKKNRQIKRLEDQVKELKNESMDMSATIQERDRHITEQGKKIYELSEKVRKRSGGAIKLDELQNIVNINK